MKTEQQTLQTIRKNERLSHTEAYEKHRLFEKGSWLARPVGTVMDLIPLKECEKDLRILDLGCGVGRNVIPLAEALKNNGCRIEGVDLLAVATNQLKAYAHTYHVEDEILPVQCSIEEFSIAANRYDLILAVSALEHVSSETVFSAKLLEIELGLKPHGIVCLIINTDVHETDIATGEKLSPQFEVNISCEDLDAVMQHTFAGYKRIKKTVVRQEYTIPRGKINAHLTTNVVTYVLQKQ